MSARNNPGANALTAAIFLLGVIALSWPLLEIPLSPCQEPTLAYSAELLTRCAVQSLLWINAIWVLLLLALVLRSRRHRRQAPPHE